MSRQHELANLLCDFELERMNFNDFDLHVQMNAYKFKHFLQVETEAQRKKHQQYVSLDLSI